MSHQCRGAWHPACPPCGVCQREYRLAHGVVGVFCTVGHTVLVFPWIDAGVQVVSTDRLRPGNDVPTANRRGQIEIQGSAAEIRCQRRNVVVWSYSASDAIETIVAGNGDLGSIHLRVNHHDARFHESHAEQGRECLADVAKAH